MAADILIDMGPDWGHVVPLSTLERISHIEFSDDGIIHVSCDPDADAKIRRFEFKSRKPFEGEAMEAEKARLLGFSNGLVGREDVETIMNTMKAQTGVEPSVLLSEPVYDISYIRRLWAEQKNEPFFRFVLQYDHESGQVMIDEDHNDLFLKIIPEWVDEDILDRLDEDEQLLLFSYEVLYKLSEEFLPEPEDGAVTDPHANIPPMGVVGAEVKQSVDLAGISKENIIMSTGD